jgi:signal transduction histidine kinase
MSSGEKELVYIILLSSIIILGFIILVILILEQIKKRAIKSDLDLKAVRVNHEKELLKTKLEIQEETLKKISREIHDNISLGLTLSKLQITNYLEKQTDINQLLNTSIDLIGKSLVDLNDISKSLDANQLLSHGLINALESEISVLKRSGIYSIELDIIGEPFYLEAETDLILLRIFQEAFNNIIKHAKANYITVDLIYEPEFVQMKIVDNGKGFDLDQVKHNKELRKMSGLNNFYTRAAVIGAKVSIISAENIGTTIIIDTPIKNEKKHGK